MTKKTVKRNPKMEVIKYSHQTTFSLTPWIVNCTYHTKIYPDVPEGCKLKHVEIRQFDNSDFFRIRFAYLEQEAKKK